MSSSTVEVDKGSTAFSLPVSPSGPLGTPNKGLETGDVLEDHSVQTQGAAV